MAVKTSIKNIWKYPLIKIFLGGIICIVIPMLINKLILENLLELTGLSETINRAIRVFITTIILMPFLYIILFKSDIEKTISQLTSKSQLIKIFVWFTISVFIIGSIFLLLHLTDHLEIITITTPKQIIVNLILILGLVITEELFFRGIFYKMLEQFWGTIKAIALSSIVFALLHISNDNTSVASFISVIVGGAVLGILYTHSRNILVPIAFHFGWNLSQVLLGFGLSGGNEFSSLYILKLNIYGSDLITGGISGIENSIISIIILIILFLHQLKIYQKNLRHANLQTSTNI